MDVGQNFLGAASAAMNDRRQNLGSSMPSAQATHYAGALHNFMEHSGLTTLEGLPLLGVVKEQVLGDECDVLPGPETQDDTLSLTELQSVSCVTPRKCTDNRCYTEGQYFTTVLVNQA